MVKTFFLFLLLVSIPTSIIAPWIGVVFYWLFAIWFPQAIWFWALVNIRLSFMVGVAVIVGFVGAVLTNKIDYKILLNKQCIFLLVIWLCILVGAFWNPYPRLAHYPSMIRDPEYLLQLMTKVILFTLISMMLLDSRKKLFLFTLIILFCGVFYVIWGNWQYFFGGLKRAYLTLKGPGFAKWGIVSPYIDENAFAMLFVMSIPFLYFMGDHFKNIFLKYFLWLNILFAWHCIFLTGSRGGLLGLGVVTLFIAFRSRKKILLVAIPVALVIAFLWQGGGYLKSRAESALSIQQDASAQSRFDSWEAGVKMALRNPVTGIGPGNFLRAYPEHSETEPHVAHNTLIQFASEDGIFAGLMYLLLCLGVFISYLKQIKLDRKESIDPFLMALNESITGSLTGFFVCSMFLDLATYEMFYYLLILDVAKNGLVKKASETINVDKTQPEVP